MNKVLVLFAVLTMVFGLLSTANADLVNLYLDTTPNDSTRAAFFTATYAAIDNGSMVNQTHSHDIANVGTLKYADADYLVYSFGDNGSRLHTYYSIPGETTASLAGRFQVSILYQDAGVWYNPYVACGLDEWVTPGSWVNYNGKVMGSMGNAIWGAWDEANDDWYRTASPEALAALALDLQYVHDYIGDTRFLARLDGVVYELRAEHTAAVPLPGTLMLLGSGLVGLGLIRKRKFFKR
ncbi:MAG: PEP-CTERM sorting domain-containing protein [Desulfobacterales bacterium]|nr:PEP-CTERM sorting domain-containing protein [Desulfobacterales bacterium]